MGRSHVLPLVACMALVAAAPADASFPGRNGKIVFGPTDNTPSNGVLLADPAVRSWQSVSTGPVDGPRNIAWSRDGRRVAFDGPATSLGSGRALYVMNADGTGLRQVGRGDFKRYNPNWSPDGTKLVFVQDNGPTGGSGDVYTMTTSGGSLTRLTTATAWDGAPDWSPDGTRIAYTCRSGGRTQVCQMSPTGASRSVTTGSLALTEIAEPGWSPNGQNLVFSAHRGGEGRFIFRMTRSGGSLKQLTFQDTWGPAWSPDGSLVAYWEYFDAGSAWLVVANAADGSGSRDIGGTESLPGLDAGAWQPVP